MIPKDAVNGTYAIHKPKSDTSKAEIEDHIHQVNDKITGLLNYNYSNRPHNIEPTQEIHILY